MLLFEQLDLGRSTLVSKSFTVKVTLPCLHRLVGIYYRPCLQFVSYINQCSLTEYVFTHKSHKAKYQ